MKLTEHFTLEELTASDTAARLGISNDPSPDVLENLKLLATHLEQVRVILGHPVHVNSGYRSPELNAAVRGAKTSQHMTGLAADIICPSFGSPLDVCRAIAKANLGIDQCIFEFGSWCHVSWPIPGHDARNELLTINADGTRQGLLQA